LKIRKVEGYTNYDKSEFDSPSRLSEDDEDLEKIWKSEHKLSEFISESNFKSYDELKKRLNLVLNLENDNVVSQKPSQPAVKKSEPTKAKTVEDDKPWSNDDDDESLSYFEKLAED
jgi:hypothetical protein